MIGIDISDQSMKIVELSPEEPRKLLAHCWQRLPDNVIERGVVQEPQVMKKIVIDVAKQCQVNLLEQTVVASIPEAQSFLRVIELPEMLSDEMDEAVQWEVAQHIPFGLENVYVNWQSVGAGHKAAAGRQEVLVGAAQKKVVDPLLAVFRELGLDVAALELESQAIVRALVSPELRQHQGLLIVDLGGVATNVVIHDHGAMRFTASLQRGSVKLMESLSGDEAQLMAVPQPEKISSVMADKIAQKLRSPQEELVMEVLGIVEFYNSIDEQHEVQEILLTGGGSNFPGLDRVFLRLFDKVHVQRGNPWVNILAAGQVKQPPLSLQESVHFTTALGLALRNVEV